MYFITGGKVQFAKDEIRQRIIDVSREEFLENGFAKASIRKITAKAGTSKSNLYNYFSDKNDLFYAVLEPEINRIYKGLEAAKQFNAPKGIDAYTLESQSSVIDIVIRFVQENITDIRILLFKSQGSSLENFKIEILGAFTDNMCAWVKSLRPGIEISRFFIRSICSFYLSMIEQAALHGKSGGMEFSRAEVSRFVYNGWKGLLQ